MKGTEEIIDHSLSYYDYGLKIYSPLKPTDYNHEIFVLDFINVRKSVKNDRSYLTESKTTMKSFECKKAPMESGIVKQLQSIVFLVVGY